MDTSPDFDAKPVTSPSLRKAIVASLASRETVALKPSTLETGKRSIEHRRGVLDQQINDPGLFLEKYGTFLSPEQLVYFEQFRDVYEVRFHLEALTAMQKQAVFRQAGLVSAQVKNRRLRYLQQNLMSTGYFDEEKMAEREPDLYHQYIGQFSRGFGNIPEPDARIGGADACGPLSQTTAKADIDDKDTEMGTASGAFKTDRDRDGEGEEDKRKGDGLGLLFKPARSAAKSEAKAKSKSAAKSQSASTTAAAPAKSTTSATASTSAGPGKLGSLATVFSTADTDKGKSKDKEKDADSEMASEPSASVSASARPGLPPLAVREQERKAAQQQQSSASASAASSSLGQFGSIGIRERDLSKGLFGSAGSSSSVSGGSSSVSGGSSSVGVGAGAGAGPRFGAAAAEARVKGAVKLSELVLAKYDRKEAQKAKRRAFRRQRGQPEVQADDDVESDEEEGPEDEEDDGDAEEFDSDDEKGQKLTPEERKAEREAAEAARERRKVPEPNDIDPDARAELAQDFLRLMQEKFLRGEDRTFDYGPVDSNTEYDDFAMEERDREERYFDAD